MTSCAVKEGLSLTGSSLNPSPSRRHLLRGHISLPAPTTLSAVIAMIKSQQYGSWLKTPGDGKVVCRISVPFAASSSLSFINNVGCSGRIGPCSCCVLVTCKHFLNREPSLRCLFGNFVQLWSSVLVDHLRVISFHISMNRFPDDAPVACHHVVSTNTFLYHRCTAFTSQHCIIPPARFPFSNS